MFYFREWLKLVITYIYAPFFEAYLANGLAKPHFMMVIKYNHYYLIRHE